MAVESRSQNKAEDRRVQIARLEITKLGRGFGVCGASLVLIGLLTTTTTACSKTPGQRAEAELASARKEANAQTMLERGKAFAAVGDNTRAEEYLATAIDFGADPREVLPLLFDVCVRTGRYRSAIQHGENHLRKYPHDLDTRVMVGALYAAISDGKQARFHLEQVVGKLDPNATTYDDPLPPPASSGSGDNAKSNSSAASANVHAITQDASGTRTVGPRLWAHAHYLLGIVARDDDNDIVAADRHFREYLKIEPNGPHAEEARGGLLNRVPTTSTTTTTTTTTPTPQTPGPTPKSEDK